MPRIAPLLLILLAACGDAPPPAPATADAPPPPRVIEDTVPAKDGVPIAYTSEGEGEPAVVLVHCWSCDRTYWRHQIGPLTESYRVVAIDLPGHGASGLNREAWTIEGYGADVATVVETLGLERVVLVGHSMGAPVALEAARRLPGKVAGVLAVDSLHDVDRRPDPEQWRGIVASYETDFAGTCDRFVRSMFVEQEDAEVADGVVLDMCAAPPGVATELMARFGVYDADAAVRAAGVPVRAINSAVFPTDVAGNREAASGFEVAVMDGVGHFPMLTRPDEFNRLLLREVGELAGE